MNLEEIEKNAGWGSVLEGAINGTGKFFKSIGKGMSNGKVSTNSVPLNKNIKAQSLASREKKGGLGRYSFSKSNPNREGVGAMAKRVFSGSYGELKKTNPNIANSIKYGLPASGATLVGMKAFGGKNESE